MIIIEEINSYDKALGLKTSWDKLIDEAELDISLSFDFVMSLWEAHLWKKDIVVLVAKEANDIVGIFPLMLYKKKVFGIFPVMAVSSLTSLFSFHNNFICKKGLQCFDLIVKHLDRYYPKWNILELSNISEDSNIMMGLNKSSLKTAILYPCEGAPYIDLEGGWERYIDRKSKHFKDRLKRNVRSFEKGGASKIIEISSPNDVDLILNAIYEIEKESWKEKENISIAQNEKQKKFYETYLNKAASGNNLYVIFMQIGDEYAAFILSIIHKNICYLLKLGYKEKFKNRESGNVSTEYIVKKLCGMGFKEYDLMEGDQPWKREWATGIKKTYNCYLYNKAQAYSMFLYFPKKLFEGVKSFINNKKVAPNSTATKLLVTIDTEENWEGPGSDKKPDVSNVYKIAQLQKECFDRFNVKPVYLVTYPVAMDQKCVSLFKEIQESGNCEIGAHLHHWDVPPFSEKDVLEKSVQCKLPRDTEKQKITDLTEKIRERFGVRPVTFRAGRWGADGETIGILSELGYKVDLSVTPLVDYTSEGGMDFYEAPFTPYFPSFQDIAVQSKGDNNTLLEIPLTYGFSRPDFERIKGFYRAIQKGIYRKMRLIGVLYETRILRKIKLCPETAGFADMKKLVDICLAKDYKVLHLTFHSSMNSLGHSPYSKTEQERQARLKALACILEYITDVKKIKSATAKEIYGIWGKK